MAKLENAITAVKDNATQIAIIDNRSALIRDFGTELHHRILEDMAVVVCEVVNGGWGEW